MLRPAGLLAAMLPLLLVARLALAGGNGTLLQGGVSAGGPAPSASVAMTVQQAQIDLHHALAIEIQVMRVDPGAEQIWNRSAGTVRTYLPGCAALYQQAHAMIPSVQSAFLAGNVVQTNALDSQAGRYLAQADACAQKADVFANNGGSGYQQQQQPQPPGFAPGTPPYPWPRAPSPNSGQTPLPSWLQQQIASGNCWYDSPTHIQCRPLTPDCTKGAPGAYDPRSNPACHTAQWPQGFRPGGVLSRYGPGQVTCQNSTESPGQPSHPGLSATVTAIRCVNVVNATPSEMQKLLGAAKEVIDWSDFFDHVRRQELQIGSPTHLDYIADLKFQRSAATLHGNLKPATYDGKPASRDWTKTDTEILEQLGSIKLAPWPENSQADEVTLKQHLVVDPRGVHIKAKVRLLELHMPDGTVIMPMTLEKTVTPDQPVNF